MGACFLGITVQFYQNYINIAMMIGETFGITENNCRLGWKNIVSKYKVNNLQVLEKYIRNGYPNVVASFDEAVSLGEKMGIAEQETRKYDSKVTKSDFIFFPGIIEEGMEINLVEIPMAELSGIGFLPLRKDSKVNEIIREASDLTILPPCVMTINPQTGEWESLDGRSRIRRAREVGAESVIAYYVPREYYYSTIIRKN